MGHYNIFNIFLKKEERAECEKKKIPGFYWYYLQSIKINRGAVGVKKLIAERINNSLFNADEIKILISGIVRALRRFVGIYQNEEEKNIPELEERFKAEISALYNNIIKKRGRKNKPWRNKKLLEIVLKADNKVLRPTIVRSKNSVRDRECLYYNECLFISRSYNGNLDCGRCEHNNIK